MGVLASDLQKKPRTAQIAPAAMVGRGGLKVGAGLAARMRGLGGCEAESEQSLGVPCLARKLGFPAAA